MGSDCPSGATTYTYSTQEINTWLQIDNQARNQVASGQLTNFDSASRMARTSWDAALAELALFKAQTCNFAHDACHSTSK